MLANEWWVWMSAALALATLEVLIPGYIFLGFAAGAFVMGALLLIGLTGMSVPIMLVVFSLLSLAAYLAMRKIFGLKKGQVRIWDRDIND